MRVNTNPHPSCSSVRKPIPLLAPMLRIPKYLTRKFIASETSVTVRLIWFGFMGDKILLGSAIGHNLGHLFRADLLDRLRDLPFVAIGVKKHEDSVSIELIDRFQQNL